MKKNRRTMLIIGVVVCVSCMGVQAAKIGTYYTTSNIWYEHPEKIYSTNYHAGKIIPAGTEIEVLSIKKGKVRFNIKAKETVFLYTYVKKHSSLSFDEEFSRIFSAENNFAEASKKFSGKEKKAVEEGKIVEGMSRKAVLAAYGYPPSHTTPDLEDDTWMYWIKRMTTRQVVFEDGKVSSVQ